MNDMPSPRPTAISWAAVRRLSLVIFPLLWGLGFLFSHYVRKCSAEQAFLTASAYILSALAGWGVFLLFQRRSSPDTRVLFIMFGFFNPSLLEPRVEPWPFSSMLAHGVIGSCVMALIMSLLFNFLQSRGKVRMGPGKSTRHSRFPFLRGGSPWR